MIKQDWKEKTIILIASGPSLTQEQIEVVKSYKNADIINIKVAGCNDAYRIYPTLDLLYAADTSWWNHHILNVKKLRISELCVPNKKYADAHGLTFINGKGGQQLSTNEAYIYYGGNSGFQLFNIAFLKGAKKIILLGYDYTYLNNKAHWFGNHEGNLRNPPNNMNNWLAAYKNSIQLLKQKNVTVINCSKYSILNCFETKEIEEAILLNV